MVLAHSSSTRSPRVERLAAAAVSNSSGQLRHHIVENISATGVRLIGQPVSAVGATVRIHLCAYQHGAFDLEARIVRRITRYHGEPSFACEFLTPSAETQASLRSMIQNSVGSDGAQPVLVVVGRVSFNSRACPDDLFVWRSDNLLAAVELLREARRPALAVVMSPPLGYFPLRDAVDFFKERHPTVPRIVCVDRGAQLPELDGLPADVVRAPSGLSSLCWVALSRSDEVERRVG